MLTGRYQFRPTRFTRKLRLFVEDHRGTHFLWRPADESDLKWLEPAVADGWRFVEERSGILALNGKRYAR